MIYHIYCDESRQTKDRFMVFSGIIIHDGSIKTFESTMAKYRNHTKMFSELKWSKVSNQKSKEYKTFIDYFFALNNTNNLHFKSIIFDNQKANHKHFNNGDREKGFQKFYYQLLLMFGREYYNHDKGTKFIIYPDRRHSKYPLTELKDILNNGLAKKLSIPGIKPFRSIEPKISHDCEMIQINDILLGAIGYQKNDYHMLANACNSKKDLCQYIKDKSGLPNLVDNTKYSDQRFTIWNFPLK